MENKELLIKIMTDYVLIRDLLKEKGGPEKDEKLFEKIINLEDSILKKFGLPSLRENQEVLWNLQNNSETDFENAINKLSIKANKYLSNPTIDNISLLNNAKKQKADPYNILKELGIKTHDYTIKICYLFYLDKISTEDTLSELLISNKLTILGSIYLVSQELYPEKSELYKELKNNGLKYIDYYIAMNKELREYENKI